MLRSVHSNDVLRHIGIVDRPTPGWTAGGNYIRMLSQSLGHACQGTGMDVFLLSQQDPRHLENNGLPVKMANIKAPTYLRGERRLRRLMGLPDKSGLFQTAREHGISVLLPLQHFDGNPAGSFDIKIIAWIPDFQHVYLPEFFSEVERRRRDVAFRALAERASLVMLSSKNALDHFVRFVPEHAKKGRVVSFPSLLAFEAPEGDPVYTRQKFNLPVKFALVANQFWRHKNHLVVIEAIDELRRKGMRIPVVMTGLPVDYRDATNQPVSEILQAIATRRLTDQITILGQVMYADLVNLMRMAAVVIQPSRFEGWSTTVQDARALGRPLICSDISVHREQASDAIGFFPCDRGDILAGVLAEIWNDVEPGPSTAIEEEALTREREFAQHHGRCILSLCQEGHAGLG